MKLRLADVVVRVRDVTIPDTCPECGKSLVGEGGLFLAQLEHVFYDKVAGSPDGPASKGEMFEFGCVVNREAYTFYACGHCGRSLASGEDKTLVTTLEEKLRLEEALQNSVWSASMDQVVFGGKNF